MALKAQLQPDHYEINTRAVCVPDALSNVTCPFGQGNTVTKGMVLKVGFVGSLLGSFNVLTVCFGVSGMLSSVSRCFRHKLL